MPSLATFFAALTCAAGSLVVAAPTSASATAPTPASAAAAPASVSVASLRATAARTEVTVRGVRRSAQARWIDRVLDDRLASLDGCLVDVPPSTLAHGVYRASVNALCEGGIARSRAAARALVRSRPWYQVRVRTVTVVAFQFTTPLEVGRGAPVEAALAKLPTGGFTYVEGDDTSMVFVGQGVTQAQVDAARGAFAAQLGIGVRRVRVSPVFG